MILLQFIGGFVMFLILYLGFHTCVKHVLRGEDITLWLILSLIVFAITVFIPWQYLIGINALKAFIGLAAVSLPVSLVCLKITYNSALKVFHGKKDWAIEDDLPEGFIAATISSVIYIVCFVINHYAYKIGVGSIVFP